MRTSFAQTYVGFGLSQAYFEYDYNFYQGMDLSIHREIHIKSTRWGILPILHVGLLYSEVNEELFPVYATTVSLTTAISFDVARAKWFTLTSYVGPCVRWSMVYHTGWDNDFFDDKGDRYSNLYGGIELGLAMDFAISDNLHFKIVPISAQRSSFSGDDDRIRQGMVSIFIRL